MLRPAAPGGRLAALQVRIEVMPEDPAEIGKKLSEWFVPESLACARVLDGAAIIAGDFRIDPSGQMRFAIFVHPETGSGRTGRIVQRLCEVETYRAMSMLGLMRSRQLTAQLNTLDPRLAALVGGLDASEPSPEAALACVRLVVQINDWSLRALGPHEMKTGFGFLQAKPSTSFAPLAVTPDELGDAWQGGRVHLRLHVDSNGKWFGHPHGGEMNFSFGQLIAHAARTRRLTAGTIIGSGTVSNQARDAGSACLAERRVIEILDEGAAKTPFMRYGDRVRMQARWPDGRDGPFGVVHQRVVAVGSEVR